MNKWQIDAMVAMLRVLKDLESQKEEKIPTLPIHRPEFTGLSASQIIIDDPLKHEKQVKKESEKMKFKVGEKVRYTEEDSVYNNQVGIIKWVDDEDSDDVWYTIKLNIGVEIFCSEEYLSHDISPKSLLKDGVVVTFRNGDRWIYYEDTLWGSSIHNFNAKFDNELIFVGDNGWDIIKLEFDGKVIWERETKPSEEDYFELLDAIFDHICDSEEIYEKDYLKIKQLIADFEKKWGLE